MSSILFGGTIFEEPKCSTPDSHDRLTSVNNNTMVPNIESDYILLLGIVIILYEEYNLTRFNHQKNTRLGPEYVLYAYIDLAGA